MTQTKWSRSLAALSCAALLAGAVTVAGCGKGETAEQAPKAAAGGNAAGAKGQTVQPQAPPDPSKAP